MKQIWTEERIKDEHCGRETKKEIAYETTYDR